MKALKVIGIIVGVLVAAILIVPLFSPSPAQVSAETEIALEPGQIFPSVASFSNRPEWDPWLTTDSTADARIEPQPGYVGSTYEWEGEAVGNGRMEVVSVIENAYIESHLWFGDAESPARVEWHFIATESGTYITWSFEQETAYPFGRLGMMIGKVFLKQSFDLGLANLKELLESEPPAVSPVGEILVATQAAFHALVASGAGTMEEMGQTLGQLYGMIYAEVETQGLQVAGPAFVHYRDYDEATGHSNYLAGAQLSTKGRDAGEVKAVSYPEMQVVQTVHTGPYEDFTLSYTAMEKYIREEGLEVKGEAFEFYTVNMQNEQDPARWQTLICFPLK